MRPDEIREHNRAAWDRMAREGHRFARPARQADLDSPLASVDGPGWLGGDITGQRVLCLAAGGGRQGPLYAAAGAIVTVVDISDEMLQLDREFAAQRGIDLRTVCASMDDLSPFPNQSFDIVIHPVSTCYVQDLGAVYREVARVLVPGGIYISQHKQPVSLQTDVANTGPGYLIRHEYYRGQPLPPIQRSNLVREPDTWEYVHSLESIIGTMCRAGFVIEDLSEPRHADPAAEPGSFGHRSRFVPPYLRIKARRTDSPPPNPNSGIWVPPSEKP